ncbi:glycosyltransferase [Galbitalea sp. SE-J8]|uniref:glycosyltransferase n=1 Tax=Galbitalea sp. SE-J8 TaxID=3054952 RepID=UPI00259C688B|nr:glycosyltransferase [Galbitalea sp. SE-J8]MDM4761944.1 glycosyltransferase [Galbitalea sp. SE-J8]
MRIAIVSDYYLDYVGGAQTSMLEQRAALERAGHEVLLIAPDRSAARTETRADGIRLRPAFTVPALQLPVIRNTGATRALLRTFLVERAVDVVHVQTEFGLAHAATTAAYEARIPVVHTVHTFYWQSTGLLPTLAAPLVGLLLRRVTGARIGDTPLADRPTDSLLRNLTLAMAERADVVVSPSAHQARDLEAALVGRPVAVVPNPIATSAAPAVALPDEGAPRLVWIARVEPEKRPVVFAEAVLHALDHGAAPFGVDIVGDGSQLGAVRALLRDRPGVVVHGALPHARVIELIDRGALVVLTSVGFDNQPMTIAEAVSRHRGVLYCDERLAEGLAHGGVLAAGAGAAALGEAIVGLVGDPARLRAIGEAAAADAAEFSGARFVERITAVYDRARAEAS